MRALKVLGLIGRRVLAALPILFGVIVVTFVMTRMLPGDPAAYFAGMSSTFEAIEQVRQKLGLDKSWAEQFWLYLQALGRGDLGMSLISGQPVVTEILTRLPASLELAFLAILLSLAVSLPLGVLAATRPNSWIDHLCRLVATVGVSMPSFFSGLMLIYFLYYLAGFAPAPLGRIDTFASPPAHITGFYLIDSLLAGDTETFSVALAQIALPAITLAFVTLAPLARMVRAAMLGVLSSDLVRTARAAGLPERKVLITYAFRNAMLPVVTTLGLVFSFMLGGMVLVEKVFAWPGIGSYALEALISLDYAPVQGFVLTMAVIYVVLNLTIDILYAAIDPRVGISG
jgi:ABC-type dipeptide/oligopeptide/nickel transport system permease component